MTALGSGYTAGANNGQGDRAEYKLTTAAAGTIETVNFTSTTTFNAIAVTIKPGGAPSITSLTPNSGAVGSSIVIAGTNFGATQGTSTVKFNGTTATTTAWNGSSITATVPTGATTGNVVVTVGGVASAGVTFTVVSAPSITSLSATAGSVGAAITITGTNFGATQGNGGVTFNGTAATVSSWGNTSIGVTVPSGATTGNVVVKAAGGVASNGVSFAVLPAISSITPSSAAVGASVTIAGTSFGATQGSSTVTFNGPRGFGRPIASVTSWSDTSITVTVPTNALSGNVIVTTSSGSSAGTPFTVILPPFISGLTPSAGPVGTSVTISGSSFGATQGASTVSLNGTLVTPTSWSDSQIVLAIPNGGTTGNIVVAANGFTSNGALFTVTDGVTPSLTNVAPVSGVVSSSITITGTGFAPAQGSSTATVNGVMAVVTSWSDTQIIASVPGNATPTGTVVVTVGGLASNGLNFTILPSISGLTPSFGPVGTFVNIAGTGFAASQGTSTLTFNGVAATPVSWSSTGIVVQVPSGATTGNLTLTVASGSSSSNFTVTRAPVVQSNGGAGVGSITVPFLSSNTAGNMLWVAVGTQGPLSPPTDTEGNTYALAVSDLGSGAIYYATSAKAGANTVTCNPGGSANLHCHIAELTGLTFSPLDQVAQSSSTTPPCSISTAAATGQASEWIGALFYAGNNNPLSAGTGYDVLQANTSVVNAALSEGRTVTTMGVQTATCGAQNGVFVGQMITTFRIAGNGPDVSGLSPSSGPVGTSVTISGINFGATQGSSTVSFNGTLATPTSWSNTAIMVAVPTGATTGPITVTTAAGTSPGVVFTVFVPPTINALSPVAGPVGGSVTILGNSFGATQGNGTVSFNGTLATPSSWNNTAIVVPVPVGATTGNVVVTANGLTGNGVLYTVTDGVTPSITGLSRNSGPIGASVTITGTGFAPVQGSSVVNFNGTTAAPTSWSDTQIVVPVPLFATSGNIVVLVGGLASNGVPFTVLPTPSITSLTPNSGTVGSSIVIAGTNFGDTPGTSTVTFNGTTATATAWSASSITATVPAGSTTGNVVVTVNGVGSSGVNFTVLTPPSITSLTPNSGAVGSSIVVAGTNFGATQGTSTVKFNGTTATATAWSASSITATVPAGATTGNVTVTVGGIASNGVTFTVVSAPSISSLSATSGPVGAVITITGTSFGATQGNGGVTFNGSAGAVSSWGNASVTVTVPNGATTGNLVVIAAGGVASAGVVFTITQAPFINSLNPVSGATGTQVSVIGINFGSTTGTVKFNGVAAQNPLWGPVQILALVPDAATSGPVTVTTSGGTQSVNSIQFTVVPTITSLQPTAEAINAVITINGSGFGDQQGTSTVTFGATASGPITSWTHNKITVTVPNTLAAGAANVVVTVNGQATTPQPFTVVPGVTGLTLHQGPRQVGFVVTGTNFGNQQPADSKVNIGALTLTVLNWTANGITVQVPANATLGTNGNVVITVGVSTGGQAAQGSNNAFSVTNAFTCP